MNYMTISMFRDLEQKAIQQRYNDIYAHELAHKHAAGSLAGSIVIDKNSNGVPVGGHVPITMPSLDTKNPKKTIQHANTVIKAALAPSDPSNQDYKVAAQAQAIKTQAKNSQNNKNLDFYA